MRVVSRLPEHAASGRLRAGAFAKAAAVAQYMTDSKEGQAFYEYDLEEGIAKFINEKTLTTSKTIEAAYSGKRYTKIEVSVNASSVE